MKLRIKDQTVRLRLSQGEVADLRDQGSLQCHTDFPGGRKLSYGITRLSKAKWQAVFDETGLQIKIPESELHPWVDTDQVTMKSSVAVDDVVLDILIEKDFKCLTSRPGEDEGDLYPNPMKSH
jgi:hypothetical protein